jgi:hypothetical protein
MERLLTRDEFREGVFERDNHKCVICGATAQDAHHILERRIIDIFNMKNIKCGAVKVIRMFIN